MREFIKMVSIVFRESYTTMLIWWVLIWLTCGVPQGTILGPLLFLLYINDLPNCLSHREPRMYADDTHLTYADNNVCSTESCLSEDLLIWPKAKCHCCFPLNRNERYSGETGCNYVITWYNNWWQTQLELYHIEKLTKKIASGIGGDLTSYMPSFSKTSLWLL